MTVARVAATLFNGNQEISRRLLKEYGYMHRMLKQSRFHRRLHQIPEALWQALFAALSAVHQQRNPSPAYLVDSCPVPVCDPIRIGQCRLSQEEAFRCIWGSRPSDSRCRWSGRPEPPPTSGSSERCPWTCRRGPSSSPIRAIPTMHMKTSWRRSDGPCWLGASAPVIALDPDG